MPLSKARAIAFEILCRVETEGAYATDLLHAELNFPSGTGLGVPIKTEDAALATELTLGVLRWRRLLDVLLERHLKKSVSKLDLAVAIALRIGLYQLWFLDRVPARAAVNESVELVKRARKSSAASLVNAVLRRAAEERPGGKESPTEEGANHVLSRPEDAAAREASVEAGRESVAIKATQRVLAPNLCKAERLGILYSHPTWLVERWLDRVGQERTVELLVANNRAPRLTCAIHDSEKTDAIVASLRKMGLGVEPGAFLKTAVTISGGSVFQSEAFRRGEISIQDEASQMIPHLLGARPSERVLDLCAAPGGKTPSLVRGTGPSGLVLAADRHMHRLHAMRAQFERIGIDSRGSDGGRSSRCRVAIVQLDAAQPLPFGAKFDRILVDAPCSGTGTLARHPEIRWRLEPEQLAQLHRLQVEILCFALEALAPGGRLVYSTCSLEPEENERVVAEILRSSPITRLLSSRELRSTLACLVGGVDFDSFFDESGCFRTVPGRHPTDGFFAAVLEKSR